MKSGKKKSRIAKRAWRRAEKRVNEKIMKKMRELALDKEFMEKVDRDIKETGNLNAFIEGERWKISNLINGKKKSSIIKGT